MFWGEEQVRNGRGPPVGGQRKGGRGCHVTHQWYLTPTLTRCRVSFWSELIPVEFAALEEDKREREEDRQKERDREKKGERKKDKREGEREREERERMGKKSDEEKITLDPLFSSIG